MGLIQIRYILILLVNAKAYECSISPSEKAEYDVDGVYYQPNTEYVFLVESKADLESASLDGLVKIGLTQVSDLANDTGQEILLNIHTMDLESGGHKALIHDDEDLTKWFSVKMRQNGVIFEVVYPEDEDLEIVNIKKNIAGMFSGHLDFKGQQEGEDVWDYHTHDIGTEGHHRSSYSATKSKDKTIFRKKRLTHPYEHGKSVHEKEIHFHPLLGISDKIKINERFDAPHKLAPGFDAYEGLPVAQSEETKINNQKDFPAMSVTSQSEISFLYSRETYTPVPPPIKLVRDSLQIKSVPLDIFGFNKTEMWSFIQGNLTCMRKDIQKVTESVQGTRCFQKLVYLLLHIPRETIDEIITAYFPEKNTKRIRDTIDRLSMLDSLMATNLEYIQDALTDVIFLATSPEKHVLERFLMLSVANNKTISKHFVAVLQTFVFQPELFPLPIQDQSLKRTAVMALGAIASRLIKFSRHEESIKIVSRIEDNLGINDPWEYNRKLGTIPPSHHGEHHFNTAAMIEALGNAGFARSLDHIVSFTNSTDIPTILRRSGLHSLRNFATKEVADILLVASEADDDKQVRKLADHLYQAHPYGKKNETYSYENNNTEVQNTAVLTANDRQRRSIVNRVLDKHLTWEFPYNSDAVLWKSGNDKLGASIGYRLRNNFKIKARLLSGVLEIDALNNAYVRLHVGILGFNVDVASADQCFDGAIEIRINPFKEIKCAVVEQFLNAFDRVIQHYLKKLAKAIEDFTDWILRPEGLPQILEDFGDVLESIPQKAYDALHKVNDALERISRITYGLLSPVIKPVSDLVLRVAQFVQDFQKDLMEFYNKISDAIIVILRSASEQLIRAIQVISDNVRLAEIVTSPHTAIDNIYKALVNSGIAKDAILQVKQILETAGILGEGPSPHWKRTSQNIASLQDELSRMKESVNKQFLDLSERINSRTIYNEVIDILDGVWLALDPLKHITDPIYDVANRFFDSSKVLKRLYQNLRNRYLDTKSEIVKVLGPNVHPDFPREIRLDGNGCQSNGFYPTNADGFYEDQGIDLVTKPDQTIVAPYSGSVSVINDSTKRVRLVPTGGEFINTVMYIDNMEPDDNIPVDGNKKVIAGTPLGITSKTGPCGSRHIHFVVKSEIDPKPHDHPRDQRSTPNGGRSGTHDSSMYLNDRLLEIRAYKRGCDEFTVKILGFSLIKGRVTQDINEKDISPQHTIDLTWLFDRRKRSAGGSVTSYSSPEWFDSESVTNIVKDLGLPIPDFGNPYPVGFNFNNLKMGSVLNFFKGLVGNDVADRMTNVLRSLVMLIIDTPCVNPTRLTKGQLARELYKRGESINGTRTELIRRYLNPDDRCPLLQISLPANTYCHIDQTCLAVECCINVPFMAHQISLKAFVRYNPCDSTLTLGIHPWNISLSVPNPDLAVEQEIAFDIDLKELGQQQVKLSYSLERTEGLFLVTFSFSICELDGECLVEYEVLKQLAFMVPTCDENMNLAWKEVDVLEYLQRTRVFALLTESGYERSQQNADQIAETLGISPDIISNLPKCRRPDSLSHQELEHTLQTYGESTQGTTEELLHRLSIAMNTCENIGISELLSSAVSEWMNCFLSPDCARIECCLRVDVLGFTPSFRIFVEMQSCNRLVAVGFENAVSFIHLVDVTQNDVIDEATFGWVKLRYTIRMTAIDIYSVSFGVAVCPSNSDCIFDTNVVESGQFVINPCDSSNNDDDLTRAMHRQKRQAYEDIEYLVNFEDNRLDDSTQYWKKRMTDGNTLFTSEENMSTRVSDIPRDESKLGNVTGSVPLTHLLKEHQQEQTSLPTENILNLPMDNNAIWPGINIVGGDLTESGMAILTNYILESDLATIQSLIDSQELHRLKSVVDESLSLLKHLNDINLSEVIKQLQQVLRELIEFNIDDILYVNLPPEFQARDFIINAVARIPESGRIRIEVLEKMFPIPIGILTLEFYVGIGAGISIEIPFSLTIGTMTYQIGITPGVAMVGWAGLGVRIFIFRVSFEFEIELLGNDVPISREVNYCKFPVEVTDRVDMVVTPLVLRLYIKVQIRFKILWKRITITLFKKELWKWSSPSLRFNLKKKVTYKYDYTIPDLFDSLVDSLISEDGKRKRSLQTDVTYPESTESCFVEQIQGLDYTEPAFYIEVAASDDVSYVTYTLSVGTEPGGNEVINDQVFGGPSAVVTQPLISGVPHYFTIRARNSAGGTASATCQLPTYDTTEPGGRLDAAFISTSHPNILKASAVLHEDSEIADRRSSVGYGTGIWGDQVVPWKLIESVERENLGSNDEDEFGHFTTPRRGRLVSAPVAKHTYLNPNFCARDCLALPASKCLSFNYDYGPSNTCELLEEIEGHGVELHQSGLFSHFERLGIGHAIEIDHDNLQLDHNNLYFFNIYTQNILGYESVISSMGILTDFTPPYPGLIKNAAKDIVIWQDCIEFVPEEWQQRCTMTTTLPNHRIIEDGEGSQTVFNGHVDFVDVLYTRANKFISANWDGFYDNETGIYGYTWSVGSDVCLDDVSSHIDPHSHLFDESEWTHEGIVTDVYLEDGHYFITVRALNKVEFGGPMAVSVCHTTPYIIDTTPPIIYSIHDVTYDSEDHLISVHVNSTDKESGIVRHDFALGKTPRDIDILPWQPKSNAEFMDMQFRITDGVPAWVKIRAVNNVNLSISSHSDTAIFVDMTPPNQGIVTDGIDGYDLKYFKDDRMICASWKDFSDPESGISSYLWYVGTYPGGSDVVSDVTFQHDAHYACSNTVSLQHNATYFSTVVAFNGGLDKLNVSGVSNGVTLDLTPPIAGYVFDGSEDAGVDLVYSSESASVAAFWGNFTDPESGIDSYEVSVYRETSDNENQKIEMLHSPESVDKITRSIEWHHFHLQHNDYVYVTLQTNNGAENFIDTNSNGYHIDLTPPVLLTIGDGEVLNSDMEFQKNTNQIATNWMYSDEESGIIYYHLAIYELKHGTKRKIYPSDVAENSFMTIEDGATTVNIQDNLQLEPGAVYTTLVKATNGAKLVSSHETTGIRIDPSPPKMIFVRAGSVDGNHEELLNGYVYQSDRLGIMASWRAVDPESRIMSYWVAVGTMPHTSDIKDFQSFGSDRSRYISGLELSLSNECQQDCQPVYYVCVKAENGAGEFSDEACSSPIKVVPADKTGYVTDGPTEVNLEADDPSIADIDTQYNANTVTVTFAGFESDMNGIRHYEWAIGTTPGGEDVQPYMSNGIVLSTEENAVGLSGSGKAQALVDLEHGKTYYATVRAITGSGDILESSSDGVTVDQTPPDVTVLEIGQHDFRNKSKQLDTMASVYQSDVSPLTAMWSSEDSESNIDIVYYSVGTYPGGNDVKSITLSDVNYIPFGDVRPNVLAGQPNKLQIDAINKAGLRRNIVFPSLIIDTSPPETGQVWCPTILHTQGHLICSWSGFFDEEGAITRFEFLIGSKEGEGDQYASPDIPAHKDSFEVEVNGLNLEHNVKYYVTIEAVNSVGLKSSAISKPLLIDNTPPTAGSVVELLSDTFINLNNAKDNYGLDVDINDHDALCIDSLWHVSAMWEPFDDPETKIVRYEVGVGNVPFGTQIKHFVEVPAEQTQVMISNIDFSRQNRVFVTVRGYNEAGLFASASSNGAYICRLGLGLDPLYPLRVRDGRGQEDRDFQTSLGELSASWDFSGYPCPFKRYEWAIRRIDEKEVQPFTDVGEQQFGTNSELDMTDRETYYVIVRGTNMMGLSVTGRSDGVTVQRDPLIPGHVFDGPFFGTDIMYQKSTQILHASWIGFGQRQKFANVYHTGNDEVERSGITDQTVDYYEVAVGTDRSSADTRYNVVPFTNVGRNTSCMFENLSLEPQTAVYYVTVRAHSVSYASTEVSSNGITTGIDSKVEAGMIDVPNFVNSLDTVDVQWSDFHSSLGIKFYYLGIADISDMQIPDLDCKSIIFNDDQSIFGIFPLRSTNLDTYMKASGLHLTQLGTYAIFVFGIDEAGECNSTSSIFTVDTSEPFSGKIKTGPYYDMPLDYTTINDELQVWWRGFDDPESGIEYSRIRLLSADSCTDVESTDVIVDWITLEGNFTEYRFVDITLLEKKPYFVELEVTNNAGSSTSVRSAPILFDESVPLAGKVVDGSDYQQDARYHGDTTSISGSFLHRANPNGSPCPLELANFANTDTWMPISMDGLWNMDGVFWDIWHLAEQVSVSNDELEISLERDIRKPRVLSGGYATNAHLLRGGLYEVEILAASSDLNAVTSIVFWDGSENTLGSFQQSDRERWWNDCLCCYDLVQNNTCLCDCEENSNISTTIPSSSTEQNYAESSETSTWTVDSGLDQDMLTNIKPACGLQLIPAGNTSQAVIWCRFENDWYSPMSITLDLPYDPSQVWHKYGLLFTSTPTYVNQMKWKLEFYIDGDWECELDGIPEMSDSAKLVLHVWNKENYVPDLDDVFHPPVAAARFRQLRTPPSTAPNNLCRYGDPFRGGSSPVVEYRAGVGSEPGSDDIVPFRTLVKPCVPCDGICAHIHCDNECQENVLVPYVFTLTNISLPESRLTDNITAPIFLTVESTLGNGHSVIASSNGITIDTSPPILDYMFYIDDSQGEFQPVNYQSSNTTIKAYWNFIDEDSEIAENLWAIGSYPGGTDIQDFTSIGLEQLGTNSSLEGLLLHNHTYYVTLRGINGAGKTKTINCPGVIVLISSPLPDGVNTTVLFSEELPENTYPPNSLKTTDSQHVGVGWSKADDDAVTKYEYCVGSSSEAQDDIVECITVGTNSSGTVTISDGGEVSIGTEEGEAKLNITEIPLSGDFNNTDANRSQRTSTNLNLEPGKTLVNTIRVCNSAELCSPVQSSETTIIPEGDSLVQSSGGEDITVTSDDSGGDDGGLRRKRSLDSSDYTLDIRTTGGLHEGGSIVFGYLDKDRLQQVYESDAVTSYQSYIVNPENTLHKTSRILRKRILHIYEPSFYLTSLGQVELNGPLQVNVTMPLRTMNISESYPTLLLWNPDDQEWQEAKYTCKLDTAMVFDPIRSMFSVQVCNTRSTKAEHLRNRRLAQEHDVTQEHFQRETQFIVAEVSNAIVNEPPVLQNFVDIITIKEDQGTIKYKLQATDPDGDVVKFYLDPQQPEVKNGDVTVTQDGLLTYTPCLDCYGEDNITIIAEEVQFSEEIHPLSIDFTLQVVITQEEDEPVLFVAQNGEVVGSSREVFITTEERISENNNYEPLSFVVGAFDVDNDETIDIEIRGISEGNLDMIEESPPKLNEYADCNGDLLNEHQTTHVPCGIEIPKEPNKLTWLMRHYKYTPLMNVSGVDELQVIARDKHGLISRHLTINIGILENPCIHGKCKGPVDDILCVDFRRSFSFDNYMCECHTGYFGDACQFKVATDAPGYIPESTNADFIVTVIAASISTIIISTIMIVLLIVYCKKSHKNSVEPLDDGGMTADGNNISMNIFAANFLRPTAVPATAERGDDDNNESNEETLNFQGPLHPTKTTVNVAYLCGDRFDGGVSSGPHMPEVD